MNKSTGFILSMVIFAIGVIAVIASMIFSGFDNINISVAICQSVAVLSMVGLLAVKLSKAESISDTDGNFVVVEQDDEFDDDEILDSDDEYYSDDTNDEYIIEDERTDESKLSYPTQFGEDEEEASDEPQLVLEDESAQAEPELELDEKKDQDEIDLDEFEEVELELDLDSDTPEPEFDDGNELEFNVESADEPVFPVEIQQETKAAEAKKRTAYKVGGVRRVKNYSSPMPKKIKLKK